MRKLLKNWEGLFCENFMVSIGEPMNLQEALQKLCQVGRSVLLQPDGADLFCAHTINCAQCRDVLDQLVHNSLSGAEQRSQENDCIERVF